jgi:hypothetical protein
MSTDNTVRTFPATKGMHPSYLMDRGLFGLGNPRADKRALQWVMRHIPADGIMADAIASAPSGDSSGSVVVVYGSGLDALAALGGLRRHSVTASSIVLVMPESELVEFGHALVS